MTLAVDDLGFFRVVAAAQNLSRAAQELGVSPSSCSRRLSAIEQRLGTQLLVRIRQRSRLTDAWRQLAAGGERLLAELSELERAVAAADDPGTGSLRVHSSLGFGRQWLGAMIADYARLNPRLQFTLALEDHDPSLAEARFDVAIRVGRPPTRAIVARRLAPNRRILVASPDYLRAAGEPASPLDLERHRCLVLRQDRDAYAVWRLRQGRRESLVRVTPALASNHGEVIREWAVAGLGIALRSEYDVAGEMRDRRLVRVLPDVVGPQGTIFALFRPADRGAAKVQRFVAFVGERLARLRDWPADANAGAGVRRP